MVRVFKHLKIEFKRFIPVHISYEFDMPRINEVPQASTPDYALGAIDLETCIHGDDNSHRVYAAGFAVGDLVKTYYLGDDDIPTPNAILTKLFDDILNNCQLNKNTFYVHNLGRFDGVFLIKGLLDSGFNVKPTLKENSILSLYISKRYPTIVKDKGSDKTTFVVRRVKILDSLQLLTGSLANLSKNFGGKNVKSVFPYRFATLDHLDYVGPTPGIEYYNNLSPNEYNQLVKPDWSFKAETLKYLESDVKSLLDVLSIYAQEIFSAYSLCITQYKTQAALAFAIYLSNFYNRDKHNIKVVKGYIEKEIRSAYYGGMVSVYANDIKTGYLYDVNSHYSAAMLNDMPTGNPIYTDNKNLEELFGFVKARVTTPSESRLKRLILPIRIDDKLQFIRGTFVGI